MAHNGNNFYLSADKTLVYPRTAGVNPTFIGPTINFNTDNIALTPLSVSDVTLDVTGNLSVDEVNTEKVSGKTDKLELFNNSGKGITIQQTTGHVGFIDCIDPNAGICIEATNSTAGNLNISVASDTATSCPYLTTSRFRGTHLAKQFLLNNDYISIIASGVFDGTQSRIIEGMLVQSTQNHSAGNLGCALRFYTVPNGSQSIVHRLSIDQNGNVGIGTGQTTPANKLTVNGDLNMLTNNILNVTNINTTNINSQAARYREYIYLNNSTETVYSLVTINQNYQVTDFVESEPTSTSLFTYDSVNKHIVYDGTSGQCNNLQVHILCEVNKACDITFHIEKNETSFIDFHEHIFTATGKIENISTIVPIKLVTNDVVEFYVSSDTANTNLTIHELNFLISS